MGKNLRISCCHSKYLFTSFLNIFSFVILAFFILLLIRSLIFWILEKDFLRYLQDKEKMV